MLSEILAELNYANFKIRYTKTTFTNREKGQSSVNSPTDVSIRSDCLVYVVQFSD